MADTELKDIGPDTPLRLAVALKLAFPAGGLTLSGLRRLIARKQLDVEVICGRQFVTLRAIEKMREKCRVEAKAHISGSEQSGRTGERQLGSSATELTDAERKVARDSALMRLNMNEAPPSQPTSQKNTTRGRKAEVIPIKPS